MITDVTDGLLLAATQIYLSLVKPQDNTARRAELRWRAADEAFALSEHLSLVERDDPVLAALRVQTPPWKHGNLKTARIQFLEECLHKAGGIVKDAAEIAGIKRTTFWMAAKNAGLIIPKVTKKTKKQEQ